jgi:hypothetical protein
MKIVYNFLVDIYFMSKRKIRIGERNYLASPTNPPFVKNFVFMILHLR